MPLAALAEMRFRASGVVPPTVLLRMPIWMPNPELPRAPVPLAFVPMKLPCTRLPPCALKPAMHMPSVPTFVRPPPEMTLRAPDRVPPTVLLLAKPPASMSAGTARKRRKRT